AIMFFLHILILYHLLEEVIFTLYYLYTTTSLLLKGYEPREKPDERFYDVMRELSAIGNNINQLAAKANTLGFVDAPQLKKEAERWHKFQADVERTFLRPDKSDMKWQ
ncbi:MobC family plasmid mobilization relaxosome protein, partial [Fusicatenibacter saccharivorans]